MNEGQFTAFKCPSCPEGVVIRMPQWGIDRGLVPQCHECEAWMERLDDNVW